MLYFGDNQEVYPDAIVPGEHPSIDQVERGSINTITIDRLKINQRKINMFKQWLRPKGGIVDNTDYDKWEEYGFRFSNSKQQWKLDQYVPTWVIPDKVNPKKGISIVYLGMDYTDILGPLEKLGIEVIVEDDQTNPKPKYFVITRQWDDKFSYSKEVLVRNIPRVIPIGFDEEMTEGNMWLYTQQDILKIIKDSFHMEPVVVKEPALPTRWLDLLPIDSVCLLIMVVDVPAIEDVIKDVFYKRRYRILTDHNASTMFGGTTKKGTTVIFTPKTTKRSTRLEYREMAYQKRVHSATIFFVTQPYEPPTEDETPIFLYPRPE